MNIMNMITGKTLFSARILAMGAVAALMLMGTAMGEVSRDGLVAEYHFDGDAKDSSGNGNDGTIYGATFVDGSKGKALSFDGVDDYVDAGNGASLALSSAITIEAWIKTSTLQNNKGVITKGGLGEGYDYMLYFSKADYSPEPIVYFYIKNSEGTRDLKGDVFNYADNKWHHYTATYDGQYIRIYIDGSLFSSKYTTLTNIRVSNDILRIGLGWSGYFNGVFDEVRIYNRALSTSEIQANYDAIASPNPLNGLVAEYHFNGDTKDSSGNGNHGTNNGATFIQGIRGQALSFDGVDDYVDVPDSPSFDITRAITIEAWVVADSFSSSYTVIVDKGQQWSLFIDSTGHLSSDHQGITPVRIASASPLSKGEWHYVANTYDGITRKLYIDGYQVATEASSGLIRTDNDLFRIGADSPSAFRFFDGKIDEVRIYNRALSATEIQAEYNAYSTTTPSPTTPAPTTTYAPQPTSPATQPATSSMKQQPLLTISQTSLKEEPEVGEEVLITVTVMNSGEAAAKNIRLTEQIPSSIAVSYIDGANKPGNLVTWEGELKPNRAHTITHTVKILEEKGRAIPVIIKYEDEEGNPKETSTTVYVDAKPHATATPTPVWTKEEPRDVNVKLPGFGALIAVVGLLAAILLVRRR